MNISLNQKHKLQRKIIQARNNETKEDLSEITTVIFKLILNSKKYSVI